jgi:hypothetical protein
MPAALNGQRVVSYSAPQLTFGTVSGMLVRMRKKRILWLTFVVALCGLAVGSFFVPAPNHPSRVTQDTFDRVQEGMTEAEVEAILGPSGYYNRRPYVVFEHGLSFRRYWLGDEGVIVIEMTWDDHDRSKPRWVDHKYFTPLPLESYGERWLRLLRSE